MKPVKTLVLAMFLVATSLANAFPIVYSLSGIGRGTYTSDGVSRSFMDSVFNLVMYGDTDSLTTGTLPTVPGSQIGESWVTQANLNRIVAVVNTSNSEIPPTMAAASPGDFQLVSRMVDGHQLANGVIVNPTAGVGLCANGLDQVACFSGGASTEFGFLTEPARLTLASAYQSTSLQSIRNRVEGISFMTTNGGELSMGFAAGSPDRPLTFSVSPVPEPSTYAMLFAGLLAIGYFLRNKGRQSLAVRGSGSGGQMMPCLG